MTLLPIPGAPGYRVDVEGMAAYNIKGGGIKPIKFRTKYKCATLYIDGRAVGTTLYRMIYCAQKKIDIMKIPSDFCISFSSGTIEVLTRSDVAERRNRNAKRRGDSLEWMQRTLDMIHRYYQGDTKPLLDYIKKVERRVVSDYINIHGFSRERAENIVGNAVNIVLGRFNEGSPVFAIGKSIRMYARGEHAKTKTARFEDWMQAIVI